MLERLALATNEPRSRLLFEELRRRVEVVAEVDFDDIDVITRYLAAFLSFRFPRREWYGNYQMHPLIQRRRRKALAEGLKPVFPPADALLMWGSWFHPFPNQRGIPFFNYIDQSRSASPVLGEPQTFAWGRKRSHRLQARTYRDASGIFCMSKWAEDQTLLAHPDAAGKVHVVGWGPCAVDLSSEDPTAYKREQVVLHISNNFYRKGVDFLVAVAARVKNLVPGARFIVIGRDASRLQISNPGNVQFTGPVSDRRTLEDYFRRATLFFLPHRFDRSPHVLVEAMSAALPLVASDQGGPAELIKGRDTGYCVPVGDIDGYTEAVALLLRNPSEAARMGQRAKALMQQQYTWPKVAETMLQIMRDRAQGVR